MLSAKLLPVPKVCYDVSLEKVIFKGFALRRMIMENVETTSSSPKWDKWKLLAIANSAVIVGFAVVQISCNNQFKDEIGRMDAALLKHESMLTDLIFSDAYYEPKALDLGVRELQTVNDHLSVSVIRSEPSERGQEVTLGLLNTSGATLSDVELRITRGNEPEGIDIRIPEAIPAGWMAKTSVVLPPEYAGQNLLIGYKK